MKAPDIFGYVIEIYGLKMYKHSRNIRFVEWGTNYARMCMPTCNYCTRCKIAYFIS